ncbi:right-handed parallel beta-helix repeat-containing protein [Streptomyces violens]|uniref:right-handed parallel beta-helix repeat-containing protein n=1 Tax=Streptomyces violens TaxID=66377 RepID=UPI0004C0FDAD|nr:right-handed parallel beta-helix repeat-containing protein [Streptomyces violens]
MKTVHRFGAAAAALSAVLALGIQGAPAAAVGLPEDVAAWQRTGQPDKLMVLRPRSVSLLSNGVVVRRLYPGTPSVSLGWLAANAGREWIGSEPGRPSTVRIRTAVLLAPDTILRIDDRTKKVLLTAGRTARSGTWISGSRAALDVDSTTLASVAEDGSSPAPASAPGRPYLSMGAGGRMDFRNATVSGFGRIGTSATADQSGVTWARGSTGSATGTTFQDNHTGLRLAGSQGVSLKNVTATGAVEDGIVLKGDRGTKVSGLAAESNGRTGIALGGTDNRTLTGLNTRDNDGAGIKATLQRGLRLNSPTSHFDMGGGIDLTSCRECVVHKATVESSSRAAVRVSGGDSTVSVQDPELTGHNGSEPGILLAEGIGGATVSGGSLSGFDRGIGITGSRVRVERTSLSANRTGIAIGGGADRVALRDVRVDGGETGVLVSGATRHITLNGVRVSEASRKGLASSSPGLKVTGGALSGGTTAVDLGAAARLENVSIGSSHRGMHLAEGVRASGKSLDVLAERQGIDADARSLLDLTDSRVRAPVALDGDGEVKRHGKTEVSLPPFPWLGFAALVALALAVVLQTLHHVRHRGTPRPKVAGHVENTA